MVYYKNLFIVIVASLFIFGCSGDGSFDEADFDEAPPSSGESIVENLHGDYSQTNWMNADYFWRANPSLSSITLPGTHNSGTSNYGSGWAPLAKCQRVDANEQLKYGVRFLDLRVGFDGEKVPMICHGKAGHANRTLNQVLLGVSNFLKLYSSECVIICLSDEYPKESPKIIVETENLLVKYYAGFLYSKPEIPHINDARGKMIYWRRYDNTTGLGLRVRFEKQQKHIPLYNNAYLNVQDEYDSSFEEKTNLVRKWLYDAQNFAGERYGIINQYVSFTSYYNVIPDPSITGLKMNAYVNFIIRGMQKENSNYPIRLGVIASDWVYSHDVYTMLCTNFMTAY